MGMKLIGRIVFEWYMGVMQRRYERSYRQIMSQNLKVFKRDYLCFNKFVLFFVENIIYGNLGMTKIVLSIYEV